VRIRAGAAAGRFTEAVAILAQGCALWIAGSRPLPSSSSSWRYKQTAFGGPGSALFGVAPEHHVLWRGTRRGHAARALPPIFFVLALAEGLH
jgi:hypothetical protein